jgi:acetyl esterase/lipase
LDWVRANGPALGAQDQPVSVFGQSAGAHLAAWLASHRSAEIRKALLFYGPTDALGFLSAVDMVGTALDDFREFAFSALATLYGARQGRAEFNLENMQFAALTPDMLQRDWDMLIPDSVFDLTTNSPTEPSVYLARCAALTGVDLLAINLAQPPSVLMACLKEDLRDFLVENSFYHRIADEAVPLFAVHGSADSLVPHSQSVNLCAAIDGVQLPLDAVDDETIYQCGVDSEVRVIKGAEHALDFGLCVDTLCPAGLEGSGTHSAAESAIAASYAWLSADSVQDDPPPLPTPVAPTPNDTPPASAGAGNSLWLLLLLIPVGVRFAAGSKTRGRRATR